MNTALTRLNTYYRKTTRFVTTRKVAHVIEGSFRCDNDSKVATTVLPFDIEDMKLLISAYDGYAQLLKEIERIFEVSPSGGCFEDLALLKNLIARLSPIYVKDVPWEDQEIGYILDESELSLSEAAERLMGGV